MTKLTKRISFLDNDDAESYVSDLRCYNSVTSSYSSFAFDPTVLIHPVENKGIIKFEAIYTLTLYTDKTKLRPKNITLRYFDGCIDIFDILNYYEYLDKENIEDAYTDKHVISAMLRKLYMVLLESVRDDNCLTTKDELPFSELPIYGYVYKDGTRPALGVSKRYKGLLDSASYYAFTEMGLSCPSIINIPENEINDDGTVSRKTFDKYALGYVVAKVERTVNDKTYDVLCPMSHSAAVCDFVYNQEDFDRTDADIFWLSMDREFISYPEEYESVILWGDCKPDVFLNYYFRKFLTAECGNFAKEEFETLKEKFKQE